MTIDFAGAHLCIASTFGNEMKSKPLKLASFGLLIMAVLFFVLSAGAAPDYSSERIEDRIREFEDLHRASELSNFKAQISDLKNSLVEFQHAERNSTLLLSIGVISLLFSLLTLLISITIRTEPTDRING